MFSLVKVSALFEADYCAFGLAIAAPVNKAGAHSYSWLSWTIVNKMSCSEKQNIQ